MTRIVIDKENEITKLENMLETLTDEKDKQSVRFAINVISDFNEVLSERLKGEWKVYARQGGIPISDYCSNCKYEMKWYKNKYNFCPNCGASMRKGGAE